MILDKKVEIIVGSHSIKHYKELNYSAVWGEKLVVNSEHLSKGSNVLINVKCDICENERLLEFWSYNENTKRLTEPYCCSRKCAEKKKKTNNV